MAMKIPGTSEKWATTVSWQATGVHVSFWQLHEPPTTEEGASDALWGILSATTAEVIIARVSFHLNRF